MYEHELENRSDEQEVIVVDQTPTREQSEAARRAEKFERRAMRKRIALLDQALARAREKAYKAHYRAVNLGEKVEEERTSLVEDLLPYHRRKAARSKQRARKHHTELLDRFFRLPREIRDLVYHHAWSGTMTSFYQELTWNFSEHDPIPWGPIVTAEYSCTGPYRASLMSVCDLVTPENGGTCKGPRHAQEYAWIWTTQQIFSESTEQFYRYTQFTRSARAEAHYYHMCAHIVPRHKLYESAYAFPNILLARHVLLDVGHEASLHIANDGILASILELLAMAKKCKEKKALRVSWKTNTTDTKPFHLKDLVPASTPHSMAARAFEELVLRDLERVGWEITIDNHPTIQ
ncbi:hypothetical protein J4E91_010922 [Alternaria rosae]|uniref:uncharacterized protein n=1 Tax=Alternaria rosae TaxID=1187941 RepID=UPI001E8E8E62|nr:uncharacterized protein BKA58DRAFT_437014 [Alternaria rosae]KAH6875015.1 hypothetical protein BKA58DRAFT_437014 [Alternaria rosae]KAI4941232.1 hypothetical protein J4E91_010922 [Alternaria rosae]